MKYLYFLLFITFISCSVTKKVYMCGDRACLDKKEFKEYFAKNLIVEIKLKDSKKNSNFDLVQLNSPSNENKKKISSIKINNKKLDKKKQKILIRNEKAKLKNVRKQKRKDEKLIIRENKKKLATLKKQKKQKKINTKVSLQNKSKKTVKAPIKKKIQIEERVEKKVESISGVRSLKESSICINIKDCDIDKIAELLINKGRQKSFPNISTK